MKINPLGEVSYRLKLAVHYLKDAEDAYRRGDYRGTVVSSQPSTENAAKAVIAFFRIPSWSHDPAPELRELLNEFLMHTRELVEELADIAESLAPEHGRATYGEPLRGLTPWDIYNKEDADRALNSARRATALSRRILKELGYVQGTK